MIRSLDPFTLAEGESRTTDFYLNNESLKAIQFFSIDDPDIDIEDYANIEDIPQKHIEGDRVALLVSHDRTNFRYLTTGEGIYTVKLFGDDADFDERYTRGYAYAMVEVLDSDGNPLRQEHDFEGRALGVD